MRANKKALFITLILLITILQPLLAIVPQVKASPEGMEQVMFGGYYAPIGAQPNVHNVLQGGFIWTDFEFNAYRIVSTDGIIKNLRVKLSVAPGIGEKYTFTLNLNGAPTALTFDIAGLDTSGSNMIDEIDVTVGDTISINVDYEGFPAFGFAVWTSVFKGDTIKESLITGGTWGSLDNAITEYALVMGTTTGLSANEDDFRRVVPTSGTIKNFYVKLEFDPGTAPDAYRFTLRKNGVSQTLTVTIIADDTMGSDLVNSFDVVAGDILTIMIEPLNTPTAVTTAQFGMTFVADINGESIVMGGSTNDLDITATEYNYLTSETGPSWTATESQSYQLGQVCTLKKLHVLLSAAPGIGNDYDFAIRIDGTNVVTLQISDAETTGNSGALEDTVALDEYVNLKVARAPLPTFTERIATFAIVPDGGWTDYDLFTLQGVPKGRIAEIVCCNKNEDFARIVGVRTDGSGINRYIDIHEAEGLGVTTATMFVKCHETTGLIEVYSEVGADVDFYLLGYFDADVDFTESITSLGQPGLAWADLDLTASGVPDDAVVQILMGNENIGAGFFAGVRANGSAIERGYILDEAEADGWTALSMVVQSDAGAVIEWKGGSVTDVTMWLLGWFSPLVVFTEGFTDYSPVADSTWESMTIAEAVASSVVAFALMHQDSGAETFCGLREEGSVLARMIEEHEAEGGDSTGFQACILLDADKKCEVYCEDASEAQFCYTGYFYSPLPPVSDAYWGLVCYIEPPPLKPNIPSLVAIVFNTTIAETGCSIYAEFFDTEGLDGYIFWNNATSAPGGVNSTFTGLTGTSDYTQENITLPSSGNQFGAKYYINDTDGNWGVDTLVMFPTTALAGPQVNVFTGSSGIFGILLCIIVPIVAFMLKR